MRFYIRHSGGDIYFESPNEAAGKARFRRIVARQGLGNAELFAWRQLWAGSPKPGMPSDPDANGLYLQHEGWSHAGYR